MTNNQIITHFLKNDNRGNSISVDVFNYQHGEHQSFEIKECGDFELLVVGEGINYIFSKKHCFDTMDCLQPHLGKFKESLYVLLLEFTIWFYFSDYRLTVIGIRPCVDEFVRIKANFKQKMRKQIKIMYLGI